MEQGKPLGRFGKPTALHSWPQTADSSLLPPKLCLCQLTLTHLPLTVLG